MDPFAQREKAFEEKYLRDEELYFRLIRRQNHLFGLWVAGLLGYYGTEVEHYIEEIVLTSMDKTSKEDVLKKVFKDLKNANIEINEQRVQNQLDGSWEAAKRMIMNEEEFK